MTNDARVPEVSGRRTGIASIYEDKPAAYFANARRDIVEQLTTGPGDSILELGCGSGGTGRLAMASAKAGRYVGIELSPTAAKTAGEDFSEVLVGDVEQMDLEPLRDSFDALIISEVLEHLTDPWTTLRRLVGCVKPGGAVFASSPNIAHWTVLKELARGRFEYEDRGVMDRTHLRWFTPASFRALFEGAGVEVLELAPLVPLRPKARLIDRLTGGRMRHLFIGQITIRGRRRPRQTRDL
jgi:2-polyprenyl-3-methyl-5-hydroxy-6-metoxy-1,4-benzoquinol methylase